jgi:hypothetical protein
MAPAGWDYSSFAAQSGERWTILVRDALVGALFFASGISLENRSMALACLGCELWSAFERQMVIGSLYKELVACT